MGRGAFALPGPSSYPNCTNTRRATDGPPPLPHHRPHRTAVDRAARRSAGRFDCLCPDRHGVGRRPRPGGTRGCGPPTHWPANLPVPPGQIQGSTGANGSWTVELLVNGGAAEAHKAAVDFYVAHGFKAETDSIVSNGTRRITIVVENRDHSPNQTFLLVAVTTIRAGAGSGRVALATRSPATGAVAPRSRSPVAASAGRYATCTGSGARARRRSAGRGGSHRADRGPARPPVPRVGVHLGPGSARSGDRGGAAPLLHRRVDAGTPKRRRSRAAAAGVVRPRSADSRRRKAGFPARGRGRACVQVWS